MGQNLDIGINFKPGEHDVLLEVLKCAKSIFEQQSMHFDTFVSSRKYIEPWFWKQQLCVTPHLETDSNLGPIWERFWVPQIVRN